MKNSFARFYYLVAILFFSTNCFLITSSYSQTPIGCGLEGTPYTIEPTNGCNGEAWVGDFVVYYDDGSEQGFSDAIFTWTNLAGDIVQSGPNFVDIITGCCGETYTVSVYHAATDCSLTTSIGFAPCPCDVVIQCNVVHPTCTTGGSISASATGGDGNYTYTPAQVLNDLSPGNYEITVTDGTGCQDNCFVVLNSPQGCCDDFDGSATGSTADCNSGTGTVSASASGGDGNYSYQWSSGDNGSSVSGLPPGNYSVVISDGSGCSITRIATIQEAQGCCDDFSGSSFGSTADCNSGTGSVSASASGGDGNYSFLWSSGDSGASVSGLSPGTYSVTISDGSGCSTVSFAVVQSPTGCCDNFDGSALGSTANCNSGTGTVSASASGGDGNYSFQWSSGDSGASVSGLSPGTYSVTISDGSGCSVIRNATIEAPQGCCDDFSVLTQGGPADCTSGLGGISTVVSGGDGNYSYSWNTGHTGPHLIGVAPGTYTVLVTDGSGCSATVSGTVDLPQGCCDDFNGSALGSVAGCNSGTGTVSASATGGDGNYSYQWSSGDNGPFVSDLLPGTYTVTISDGSGCSVVRSAIVETPQGCCGSECTVSVLSDSNCGPAEGSLTVTVSGGQAPFQFLWSSGETTQTIANKPGGLYQVTVTDDNGCSTECQGLLNGELTLEAKVLREADCQTQNGDLMVRISRGDGPYQILWSNGATTQSILDVVPGNYQVTVTDEAGCEKIDQITLNTPNCGCSALAPSVTDDQRCGPGIVNLSADDSDPNCNIIRWYTASTGGTPVSTGTSYSPNLSNTTVFFVACYNSTEDCESSRTSVAATINPELIITSVTPDCSDDNTSYTVDIVTQNATTLSTTPNYTVTGGPTNWTIAGVPIGESISVNASNSNTGCSISQIVDSPICIPGCTPEEYTICDNGSSSATLSADPGLSTVIWFEYDLTTMTKGSQVGTGPTLILTSQDIGPAGSTKCFIYEANDANGCPGETCCPVCISTESCCPDDNCYGVIITRRANN